jgi:predicted HTH domain antitoxin
MPPKSRLSDRNLVEQEGRIQLAISAINKGEITSLRRAVEIFNVPYSTLRDRIKGKQYRIEQRANSHRLSKNEEASLVKWILSRDARGVAPRPFHVAEIANILLGSAAQPLGKN